MTSAAALDRRHLRVRLGRAPRLTGRPGAVWRRPDGSIEGRAFIDGLTRWLEWDRIGRFRFRRGRAIVEVYPRANVEVAAIVAEFEGDVGAVVFQGLGRGEALHAAAAVGPTGALAICGQSHAGKSTLSYGLGRRPGWRQLADDQVLLSIDAGQAAIVPRAFVPSLRPASQAHFGTTAMDPAEPPPSPSPLAAVVLLEPVALLGRPHVVNRLDPADAFTAVLPHAHCFVVDDPAVTAAFVERYFELIDSVPIYRVRYRPSFDHFSDLVSAVAALAAGDAPGVER